MGKRSPYSKTRAKLKLVDVHGPSGYSAEKSNFQWVNDRLRGPLVGAFVYCDHLFGYR
ncbi:MAG: hypothetical protein AAB403_14785 [Planctomycetota bacterium]